MIIVKIESKDALECMGGCLSYMLEFSPYSSCVAAYAQSMS